MAGLADLDDHCPREAVDVLNLPSTVTAVIVLAAAAVALLTWVIVPITRDRRAKPGMRYIARHRRRGGVWKREPGPWSDEDLASMAEPEVAEPVATDSPADATSPGPDDAVAASAGPAVGVSR